MLTGYTDRLSAGAGERVEFKVNSEEPFELRIVRLFQGDDTDTGPGYLETEIASACDGTYPARAQRTEPGSYVRVEHDTPHPVGGVTLLAWVWPTTPDKGRQGILTKWAPDGTGYGLEIADGTAVFSVRCGDRLQEVRAKDPIRRDWWHLVVGGYDASSGRLFVRQLPQDPSQRPAAGARREATLAEAPVPPKQSVPILIAAAANGAAVGSFFNGRISEPRWFGRVLDDDEVGRVVRGDDLGALAGADYRAWDLSPAEPSSLVLDRSGRGGHGTAVNNPARAVRGARWDGSALRPADAPDHYDCMHFHDDDLSDARWETNAALEVPDDWPSGVYAARLRTRDEEDYLPFVVRPAREPTARALFVLPTLSYVAYANERYYNTPFVDWTATTDRPLRLDPSNHRIAAHPEFGPSLYDPHSDGTYTAYSSRLRPILNLRPKIVSYWNGAGRHFCADLYLLGWLHREDVPVDVVTDEDVHRDGAELLGRYDVVITGSHPEYTTERMLDAFIGYTTTGGRLMYLGGNGFRWVTTIDPSAPHVIEVRKDYGVSLIRGIALLPGEEHHSQTGTRGGYWPKRGRGSEAWLGIGTAGVGWAQAQPFHRTEASYDPAVSWIFDGVDGDTIGASGLALGGAAGDEMDSACALLGTPPQTVIVASSRDHGPQYHVSTWVTDPDDDRLRADITYLEYDGGGAAFSAGSMCWYPSLACNDYDNDIAQVTRNVLRRFLRPRSSAEDSSR